MEALQIKELKPNPDFNLDDERITALCQANDAYAQEVLYNRFVNTMIRTCLRYMNDEYDAEDIMIGGFVKVFSKINTFEYRGPGSLEGWIKRIMVNECLMSLRKKKFEKIDINGVGHMIANGEPIDSPILAEEIFKLVQKLPKGYRTVFNMYAIEGYSHKEIGEKLGINENTSKSQLSKARSSLKRSLEQLGMTL